MKTLSSARLKLLPPRLLCSIAVAASLLVVHGHLLATPAADSLFVGQVDTLVIGETHGTKEIPAAFYAIVDKESRSGRPLVVALEMPFEEIEMLNAVSLDRVEAHIRHRQREKNSFWAVAIDGRTSSAMVKLYVDLRRLAVSKRLKIVGFDTRWGSGSTSDLSSMAAAAISTAQVEAGRGTVVLVLVGNFHADEARGGDLVKALALTKAAKPAVLLSSTKGGLAWVCMRDECRVHAMPISQPSDCPESVDFGAVRSLQIVDGQICIGSITASDPFK